MAKKVKKNNGEIINIDIDITLDTLEDIILYLFSESIYINKKSLNSLRKLFRIINIKNFENDDDLMARISFIKKVLIARLEKRLNEYSVIINYANSGKYKTQITEDIIPFIESTNDLKTESILFLNSWISENLKYAYLYAFRGEIVDNFDKLMVGNYDSLESINDTLKDILQELFSAMRRAENEDENSSYVDLTPEIFNSNVADSINRLKLPTNHLKTGIKWLNEMLQGGFESARCYIILGVTGGFKSGMMLNLLYQIKKHNPNFKTKDPKKIPCLLYVTQENSIDETIERMYNISVSSDDLRDYDTETVLEQMKDNGLSITEEYNINIRMIYKPSKSISTEDLYTMIDDIEEEGQEVICLVHDYTKRIKSSSPDKELRIELGNVIDDFCVLAKAKRIPVITAAQFNRAAMAIVEEAILAGRNDAINKIGISNTGESYAMIENADYVFSITQETIVKDFEKEEFEKWLSIRGLKTRAKKAIRTSFYHPFAPNNGIKLVEDEGLKHSVSVTSLSKAGSSQSETSGFTKKTSPPRRVKKNKQEEERESKQVSNLHSEIDEDMDDMD